MLRLRPVSCRRGLTLVATAVPSTVPTATPSNDASSSPTALTGSSGFVTGSTAGATGEASLHTEASVWFSWVAPSAGIVSFSTTGSAFAAAVFLVRSGVLFSFGEVSAVQRSARRCIVRTR
jgi:hypothetical protein